MKRRLRVFLVGGFFLLAIVLPASVTFYTDWLWFGETGYQDVFAQNADRPGRARRAGHRRGLRRPVLNLRIAMRTISPRQLVRQHPRGSHHDRHRSPPRPAGGHGGGALLALLFGLVRRRASGRSGCSSGTAQPFGDGDPMLGRDVGFYVFRLPFLEAFRGYLFAPGRGGRRLVALRCTCSPAPSTSI